MIFPWQDKFEEQFGKSAGLPASNDTRWNSVLRQINSVVDKGMNELNSVTRADNRRECIFSCGEWSQLRELIDVLEPFRAMTDQLQGDKVRIDNL